MRRGHAHLELNARRARAHAVRLLAAHGRIVLAELVRAGALEARDAAARARFGMGSIELVHRLHGTHEPGVELDVPGPPIAGWNERKSFRPRASCQTCWARVVTRASSSTRSFGSFTARS